MGKKGGKKGAGKGAAPARGKSESDVHVLGAENARKLAHMHTNALKVLRDECGACHYVPLQGEKFRWAAVATLDDVGNVTKDFVYLVEYDDLTYRKQTLGHNTKEVRIVLNLFPIFFLIHAT